jgi:hypothetical protein
MQSFNTACHDPELFPEPDVIATEVPSLAIDEL